MPLLGTTRPTIFPTPSPRRRGGRVGEGVGNIVGRVVPRRGIGTTTRRMENQATRLIGSLILHSSSGRSDASSWYDSTDNISYTLTNAGTSAYGPDCRAISCLIHKQNLWTFCNQWHGRRRSPFFEWSFRCLFLVRLDRQYFLHPHQRARPSASGSTCLMDSLMWSSIV
jgi:hypothetical protein